jgi:hypothetical protein
LQKTLFAKPINYFYAAAILAGVIFFAIMVAFNTISDAHWRSVAIDIISPTLNIIEQRSYLWPPGSRPACHGGFFWHGVSSLWRNYPIHWEISFGGLYKLAWDKVLFHHHLTFLT